MDEKTVLARQVLLTGEVLRLPSDARGLRVRSGRAWLSLGGQDHILSRGDELRLECLQTGRENGLLSAEGGLPLMVELLGRAVPRPVAEPRTAASPCP